MACVHNSMRCSNLVKICKNMSTNADAGASNERRDLAIREIRLMRLKVYVVLVFSSFTVRYRRRSRRRGYLLAINLMNFHIQSHPKLLPSPFDSCASIESPEPDRKGESLSTQPCQQPLSKRSLAAGFRRTGEEGCVVVEFDRGARVKLLVEDSVHETPDGDAQEPEASKSGPCLGDAEGGLEEGEGGCGESAIG